MALLRSFLCFNEQADVYIISNDILCEDLEILRGITYHFLSFEDSLLDRAPISKRYPKSIYHRIFAPKILPNNLDRVLYLDPDIIINGNLEELYNMDFEGNYFVGATNVGRLLTKFNEVKNKAPKGAPYLNTGVLLMNLTLLRNKLNVDAVCSYINKNKHRFTLPDQDIISGMFGDKIKTIDHLVYNISDRAIRRYNYKNFQKPITLNWVKKNVKIIHYYGRNKPWNQNYRGILKGFYDRFKQKKR